MGYDDLVKALIVALVPIICGLLDTVVKSKPKSVWCRILSALALNFGRAKNAPGAQK